MTPQPPKPSRRQVIRQACDAAAAFAIPLFVPARALGRNGATAPSNRIHVAAIGLGFAWPMFLREDTQFMAVCDVQPGEKKSAIST